MQNKLFQEHLNVRTKYFDIGHLCSSGVTRGGGLYRHSTVVYTERTLAAQSYIHICTVTLPPPPHHPPPPPTSLIWYTQNTPIMLFWSSFSRDWSSPSSLPSVRGVISLYVPSTITAPVSRNLSKTQVERMLERMVLVDGSSSHFRTSILDMM